MGHTDRSFHPEKYSDSQIDLVVHIDQGEDPRPTQKYSTDVLYYWAYNPEILFKIYNYTYSTKSKILKLKRVWRIIKLSNVLRFSLTLILLQVLISVRQE